MEIEYERLHQSPQRPNARMPGLFRIRIQHRYAYARSGFRARLLCATRKHQSNVYIRKSYLDLYADVRKSLKHSSIQRNLHPGCSLPRVPRPPALSRQESRATTADSLRKAFLTKMQHALEHLQHTCIRVNIKILRSTLNFYIGLNKNDFLTIFRRICL